MIEAAGSWVDAHAPQLACQRVPRHLWPTVERKLRTQRFDWTAHEAPPGGPYSLVLGADVLYDRDNAKNIAKLLPAMLVGADQKCLIADQTQWPWREEFRAACAEGGLEVSEMPLPGPEDVKLLAYQHCN